MPAKHATISDDHLPLAGLDDPVIRAMARAATGDPGAIDRLASHPDVVQAVAQNRLAPLFALHAHDNGLPVPARWQESLRQTAILRMLLDESLAALGRALDAAGVPWVPLKGMGLPARLYPRPECRPTTDIDVLVSEAIFLQARDILRAAGWEDMHTGPAYEDFLLKEGYNWQARHTQVMLELHFRLWGPVDPGLPAAILDTARPAPDLGTMARLSPPADSYIVAACHLWNSPRPVALLYFLDLHLLTQAANDEPDFPGTVIALARRHDVQLFVGLAAAITTHLWPSEEDQRIATALLSGLRPAEKFVLRLARRRPPHTIPLGALVLARLLSHRKSRTGWRAPLRQIWPHPAIFQASNQKGPLATLRRTLSPHHS